MKPAAVLEKLELAIGLDGVPISILLAIESVLIESFELPSIQAAEKSEVIVERVAKLVEERQSLCQENGTFSTLCLLGSSQDIIAGSCHILPIDDFDVINAKKSRLHVGNLLAAIRELTFNDFEKFGARVLMELGAQKVRVTPQSNDQGIDFYGVMNIGQLQKIPAAFFYACA